jgi:hypothetical protein
MKIKVNVGMGNSVGRGSVFLAFKQIHGLAEVGVDGNDKRTSRFGEPRKLSML